MHLKALDASRIAMIDLDLSNAFLTGMNATS
jgi:hypothetical protein